MKRKLVSSKKKEAPSEELSTFHYFPCAVYTINKPEFLPTTREVCKEYLEKQDQSINDIYPVHMTGDLYDDPRMEQFCSYIGDTSWTILQSQGYAMQHFQTYFQEMWCQEHFKSSAMEQHVHGFGCQLVGFYFVDVPENSSRVVFHDPKAGKVQANLPEADWTQATLASNMINFVPKSGMLMITNAWLAHSFTRNASENPIRFIHFNIGIIDAAPQNCVVPGDVEII